MVGPTPVSALIHAATMVTAGVYMIARLNFLYTLTPDAMDVVAVVGAVTAFFAATIALVQTDIKRVLAYSTISQLGYMFMGVGAGAFAAGIFHVMTHAFFKGLLFLCAGSIIHALDGEQDMSRMGALWRRMPITYATMLAATLAISAVPGFSGYFSKDLILERTFAAGFAGLWLIGVITAGLTAFYMFRLLFLTFHGSSRVAPDTHVHESPPVMTVPLVILGVLSVVGGWVGLPDGWLWGGAFTRWLAPVLGTFHTEAARGAATSAIGWVALAATFIGFALAYILYIQTPALPGRIAASASALYQLLVRKYYVDELYNAIFGRFLFWGSENVLNRGVDHGLIDGLVNGTGAGVEGAGEATRRSETGNVQMYAFVYLVGAVGNRRLLRLPGDGALMGGYWLTALVFTPLLGALFVLAQPEARAAWRVGFIFSLIPLAISIYLFAVFDAARPATSSSSNPRGFRSSASRITSGWTGSACSWCC